VKESYFLFLDDTTEREQFDSFRRFGQNTLIGWRNFFPFLKYHVSGSITPVNISITARRHTDIGVRPASIDLDYALPAPVFTSGKAGSRKTVYTLDESLLKFGRTASQDIMLTPVESLEFVLPPQAILESQSPAASSVTTLEGRKDLRWDGPVNGKWSLVYSVEKPLNEEVGEYFASLSESFMRSVPFLLPLALVALLALFLYVKYFRKG